MYQALGWTVLIIGAAGSYYYAKSVSECFVSAVRSSVPAIAWVFGDSGLITDIYHIYVIFRKEINARRLEQARKGHRGPAKECE
jgi:hypothetical protein